METYRYYYVKEDGKMFRSDVPDPNAIEVDEMMQPIISILNEKGFKTFACCSGHICPISCEGETLDAPANAYIGFNDSVVNMINNGFKLPSGFKFDIPDEGSSPNGPCTIRKIYYSKSDLWTQILETMGVLYRWALNLPYVNKREVVNNG